MKRAENDRNRLANSDVYRIMYILEVNSGTEGKTVTGSTRKTNREWTPDMNLLPWVPSSGDSFVMTTLHRLTGPGNSVSTAS